MAQERERILKFVCECVSCPVCVAVCVRACVSQAPPLQSCRNPQRAELVQRKCGSLTRSSCALRFPGSIACWLTGTGRITSNKAMGVRISMTKQLSLRVPRSCQCLWMC